MTPSTDAIQRHITDGETLRSGPDSPTTEALGAYRKRYLAWVDDIHQTFHSDSDRLIGFESIPWQIVIENQVSDAELVRAILGDVDHPLFRLNDLVTDLAESSQVVPPRWIAEPGTVGMAVFDATCLFSKHTRHLLLGLSVHGVVLGRWSRQLLAEAAASLAKKLRGDSLEDLGAWLKQETGLVRDGLVDNYEHWLDRLSLPDPDDAHVVASAIACGATKIVTDNIKDFPDNYLDAYEIKAVTPDQFALECINANPVLATRVVTEHPDPRLFLDKLTAQLPNAAALLRELLD